MHRRNRCMAWRLSKLLQGLIASKGPITLFIPEDKCMS